MGTGFILEPLNGDDSTTLAAFFFNVNKHKGNLVARGNIDGWLIEVTSFLCLLCV